MLQLHVMIGLAAVAWACRASAAGGRGRCSAGAAGRLASQSAQRPCTCAGMPVMLKAPALTLYIFLRMWTCLTYYHPAGRSKESVHLSSISRMSARHRSGCLAMAASRCSSGMRPPRPTPEVRVRMLHRITATARCPPDRGPKLPAAESAGHVDACAAAWRQPRSLTRSRLMYGGS